MTKTNEEVKVNDGGTLSIGSDRYPFTVIEILAKNKIVVQIDEFKIKDRTDGYAHEFSRDENGRTYNLIKVKRGWKVIGQPLPAFLGERSGYIDPHF